LAAILGKTSQEYVMVSLLRVFNGPIMYQIDELVVGEMSV